MIIRKLIQVILVFWIILLLFPVKSFAKQEDQRTVEKVKECFPCQLKIISWVSVVIEGELLKKHEAEFRRLIRVKLKNDLPMIAQEVTTNAELLEKHGSYRRMPPYTKRGLFYCKIWTAGDTYPIATLIECTLTGWGEYEMKSYGKFCEGSLGNTSAQCAKQYADDSISKLVDKICNDFLKVRHVVCK